MSTSAPAATNFVSQASQSEEVPAQLESSQLLISSIASKSEGIPINKLMSVEEDGRTSDEGQGGEDVNTTRPADSSEIRKRRLEKLVSREADHPQQAQSEETRDDKADT